MKMPIFAREFCGSLASACSAGALSVLTVMEEERRIGVVVAIMPLAMSSFFSDWMNVVVR